MSRQSILSPPAALNALETALGSAIRGKPEVIRLSIVCLLARGHLLIEYVPGVGKTTLAHSLARAIDCSFHRIQFTSDLLPSDVLGVTIYNTHSEAFEFRPGPVFTNILLADEINRTTPKTQSALLECMNEGQVTIDGRSLPLPEPFFVVATQNPSEHHGAYPLPESQLDRFLLRLRIGYPDAAAERDILRKSGHNGEAITAVCTGAEIIDLQRQVELVRADESILDYILAIVERTRTHEALLLGVSPRGTQAIFRAAQARAFINGRDYLIPDDVKSLVIAVFAHRIIVQPRTALGVRRGEAADRILEEILTQVEVPL
jgi:MoxR-like ATPase